MSAEPAAPLQVVYSVGHSNHALEHLLALLRDNHIEVLVDVRSAPYSKQFPHFDQKSLRTAVVDAGLQYLYLGRELGGRPTGEEFYDGDQVVYERVAATSLFRGGLERLLRGSQQYRVAMLCSEEDPSRCHRHRLIGHELRKQGIELRHIRGDGRVEREGVADGGQLSLFGPQEEPEWKSIRLASRKDRRATSSER
jgi:uncharacterized protein (DUF488 family)